MQADGNDEYSRGTPMMNIYDGLGKWAAHHCPRVSPSDNHKVMYNMPLLQNGLPPKPRKGPKKWDTNHVRLPSSIKCEYPVHNSDTETDTLKSKWELINSALTSPIRNSRDLETAIHKYNSKYARTWKFKALHKLFEEELDELESDIFFQDLLPKIIELALRLPELIATAIPLLRQGKNMSISLSQQQISCLLANAFLCTFPRRNTFNKKSEYNLFPDINFNRLFQSSSQSVLEKLKCFCHYFRRVCTTVPTGCVTITRRFIDEHNLPVWSKCDSKFNDTPFHIASRGTIEDQGEDLLQVDFANKFLGGGVLGQGCVQEEIRFVICPELMITKLFTEALTPHEALLIVGCERYSNYSGYASTFQWASNYVDETPLDESCRRKCHIVAIDALHFTQPSDQFRENLMKRELDKAFVGFYNPTTIRAPGVASGNWGCGAFGGESLLKALLQLMVCTVVNRPLVYFTFENDELRDDVFAMYKFLIEKEVTVAQLWRILKDFKNQSLPSKKLYSFIYQKYYDDHGHCLVKVNQKELKPLDVIEPFEKNESLEEVELMDTSVISDQRNSPVIKDDTRKKIKISLIDSLDQSFYNSTATITKRYCPPKDGENNDLCEDELTEVLIDSNQTDNAEAVFRESSRESHGITEINNILDDDEADIPGTPPPPEARSRLAIYQNSSTSSSKSKISDYFTKLMK